MNKVHVAIGTLLGVLVLGFGWVGITSAAGCTPFLVASGGTGVCAVVSGDIPFGNGTAKIATSTGFTFDNTNAKLSFTYGSTTALTASGTVYSALASTSNLTISNLGNTGTNCLQITNQGVVSATGAACNSGTVTSVNATVPSIFSVSGVPFTTSGTIAMTYSGTALPLANGGTNATSFTTSNNSVYYNGTSLLTAPLTSAVTTPYASSTAISAAGSIYINSPGSLSVGSSTPFASSTVSGGAIVNAEALISPTSTSMIADMHATSTQGLFQIGTAGTTITLTGYIAGETYRAVVCNPNAVAGALTWATNPAGQLRWPGGSTPTQTTTANKCDVWSFLVTQATSTNSTGANLVVLGAQTASF